jgi:DNA-binding MarR family transcriptional regulator
MIPSEKKIRSTRQASGRKQHETRRPGTDDARDDDAKPGFVLLPTVSKSDLRDKDDNSDRHFRQFLYSFSCLAAHLQSARAYLASHLGVSSAQYNIIMVVAQHQGAEGLSVTDLAGRLHVTNAFITNAIGKLERAGLVEKRRNPNDGRGTLLRLTPVGEESVQQIGPQRLFVNNHLFREISGDDFRRLSRTVSHMIDDFAHTVETLEALQRGRTQRAARLAARK